MIELLANVRAAIHETAERLRALPDAELVRLAMAAGDAEPGKPVPTAAIRAERRKPAPKPRKVKVAKAPANPPKKAGGRASPKRDEAKQVVLHALKKGPMTHGQLLAATDLAGWKITKALRDLASEQLVGEPEQHKGPWRLA